MGIFEQGPTPPPQPQGFNPLSRMQEFFKFVQDFRGDPEQQVRNMLSNGQMTQYQFDQVNALWQMFGQFFRR